MIWFKSAILLFFYLFSLGFFFLFYFLSCGLLEYFLKFHVDFFSFFDCGRILVPQPGIEPELSAVKAKSPNHWITREFPPY